MGRPRRVTCRVCGGHIDDVGPLSARGLCEGCGLARVVANQTQLLTQRGPFYDRWVAGVLDYAGPALERALEGDEELEGG